MVLYLSISGENYASISFYYYNLSHFKSDGEMKRERNKRKISLKPSQLFLVFPPPLFFSFLFSPSSILFLTYVDWRSWLVSEVAHRWRWERRRRWMQSIGDVSNRPGSMEWRRFEPLGVELMTSWSWSWNWNWNWNWNWVITWRWPRRWWWASRWRRTSHVTWRRWTPRRRRRRKWPATVLKRALYPSAWSCPMSAPWQSAAGRWRGTGVAPGSEDPATAIATTTTKNIRHLNLNQNIRMAIVVPIPERMSCLLSSEFKFALWRFKVDW